MNRATSAGRIALALLFLPSCGGEEAPPTSAAPEPAAAVATGPDRFVRRSDTGLDFVHRRYTTEDRKYLPETTGAGLGLLDYDGDGDLDVYLLQGCPLPGYRGPLEPEPNRLFRNDGNLHFTDVTEAAGVGDLGYGMGVTCPDLDGDGFPELFVTNVRDNVLYRNRGDGTFEDVTAASGLADPQWSTAACWADFDRDGDLDLYLCSYAVCDFENYSVCKAAREVSYCHPDTLLGAPDHLFRNDGNLHFTDVTDESGIRPPHDFKGLAAVPLDHDGDGWIDLFIANDSNENFLWLNRGGLRFEEMAGLFGVAVSGQGKSQACMGTDVGDVDGDLDFDIFAANFGKESNVLYVREDEFYDDRARPSGLGEPSYLSTGFGAELFDYDRDGDLDLMVVNGHVVDLIEKVDPSQTFLQRPHFYENRGDGTFVEIGARLSPFFTRQDLGRGLAVGDLDDDGDLDVVVSHNDSGAALLENTAAPGRHWISLRLVGTVSPRDAIGARVWLTCGDRTQVEEIRGSTSFLSWTDLRLYFGLGEAREPCRVRIRWPSGREQELDGLEVDRFHTITEPDG